MEIEHVDPARLLGASYNPRQIETAQFEALKRSISRWGFVEPVIINKRSGLIVGGHQRAKAAIDLALSSIPVTYVDLDGDAEKALNIALNKIAGDWDEAKLADLLADLEKGGQDLADLGFDADELGELLADLEGAVELQGDLDEIPEPPAEPITQPGDLWQLGEHRLLCGDSTKAEDAARLMGGATAGLMVTDPPYGVNYEGGQVNNRKRERLAGDQTSEIFGAALSVAVSAVPIGAWYIWHAGEYAETLFEAVRKCGFEIRSTIIWHKLKAGFGAPAAHYCQKHEPCLYAVKGRADFVGPTNEVTVWEIDQPRRNEHHPTQKPVVCMARAISNHGAKSVYDPFVGSGTTIIAAEQTGRKCYAMELSPAYCDVAVKRWEQATGRKAERIAASGGA
jgi:DNA modification methylase